MTISIECGVSRISIPCCKNQGHLMSLPFLQQNLRVNVHAYITAGHSGKVMNRVPDFFHKAHIMLVYPAKNLHDQVIPTTCDQALFL